MRKFSNTKPKLKKSVYSIQKSFTYQMSIRKSYYFEDKEPTKDLIDTTYFFRREIL